MSASAAPSGARREASPKGAVLASFEPFVAKSELGQRLTAVLVRRRQLGKMLKAEKNRLRTAHPDLEGSVETVIGCLTEEMRRLDGEVRALLDQDPEWQKKEQLLQSAQAVGPVTAATLPAKLPELGTEDFGH